MMTRGDAVGGQEMLELRSNCERCNRELPPHSEIAMICSFECTFCAECAAGMPSGLCPNCGGELVRRPIRPARLLDEFPPATRVAAES